MKGKFKKVLAGLDAISGVQFTNESGEPIVFTGAGGLPIKVVSDDDGKRVRRLHNDLEELERRRLGALRQYGRQGAKAARAVRRLGRHPQIIKVTQELIASGHEKRDIAGIVARRLGCTAHYVRWVLRSQKNPGIKGRFR